MITLWGDAQDTINRLKPSEPLFMRVNSCDCMAYTLANLVPNVYELDDFQVRTPTDVIGQHIHLVKFDVTSSDGSSNGWNYEDGTFGPNEVTERINALNKVSGLQRFPGSTTPKTLTARDIRFFGPGPGAQPTNPDTGEWMGAQATVQRWYNDPLFNNIGVCSTNLDILCTIGEDAPYFKAELAGMGCPKFGICLPSAGFCSDNGARCAEDRKEQCGDPILAECHPTPRPAPSARSSPMTTSVRRPTSRPGSTPASWPSPRTRPGATTRRASSWGVGTRPLSSPFPAAASPATASQCGTAGPNELAGGDRDPEHRSRRQLSGVPLPGPGLGADVPAVRHQGLQSRRLDESRAVLR